MRRLALWLLLLLAVMVSSGANAGGVFGVYFGESHEVMTSNPLIKAGVNLHKLDGTMKSGFVGEGEMPQPSFGDKIEVRLTATVNRIILNGKQPKNPVTAEWYRPNGTNDIPYEYGNDKKARERNEAQRIHLMDSTDGTSPISETFYPAECLNRGTYVLGTNTKVYDLRLVNGQQILDQLKLLGFKINTVTHGDVWIQVLAEWIAGDCTSAVPTSCAGTTTTTPPCQNDGACKDLQTRMTKLETTVNNNAEVLQQVVTCLQKQSAPTATQQTPPPPTYVSFDVFVSCVTDCWSYQTRDCKYERAVKGPYSLKAGVNRVTFDNVPISIGTFEFRVYDHSRKEWGCWQTIALSAGMGAQAYAFPGRRDP